jgi:tetratricopeptide (TPR) repeat protein
MSIAALIAPLALLQAGQAAATHMPALGSPERLAACVALIDDSAEKAYEEGMAWAAETHEVGGYRCAAMALAAEGRNEEAARRFESLAGIIGPESTGLRAELYSQAGNAWLLAHEPSQARSAFTRGIATLQGDPENMPDLLIDRARAYALEGDYHNAELDLSHALDIRANDALALRLRASARMHQRAFDLAEADARAAVALEPTNVDALLMLGHAREAKRTGEPVEEQ